MQSNIVNLSILRIFSYFHNNEIMRKETIVVSVIKNIREKQ